MQIFIGIDDTDNAESRGTGHLARAVAQQLEEDFCLLGIVRHQLFFDRRVPYTSHNSSAALILEGAEDTSLPELFARVKTMLLADFQPGSDPGLCVASRVAAAAAAFGRKAQTDLVSQAEARRLAAEHGFLLEGLGGTEDGVIGALAAVGLASTGSDGRYVQVGRIRQLSGLQPVWAVLAAGIQAVKTEDEHPVLEGMVLADKLRPARRGGVPVLYVSPGEDAWLPLKLN